MSVNNFRCSVASLYTVDYANTEAIVLLLCRECAAALQKLRLPAALAEAVEAVLTKNGEAIYAVGEVRSLAVFSGGQLQQLLIAGCGCGSDCKPNNFRKAAGAAARELQRLHIGKAVLAAPLLLNPAKAHYLQAVAEGLYLGAYKFTQYKSTPEAVQPCAAAILTEARGAAQTLEKAAVIAEGISYARDLINRPGNSVTPQGLAEAAAQVAEEAGLELEVLTEKELAEQKMQAILAVGQGSCHAPRLIVLKYCGAKDAPWTAYVGKGITFDSGGISLKPADKMGEMKDDMSGAAAVLAALRVIARLHLPCNILGIMSCAENMPGGQAQRPGDIVRAASGKTIEVVSTDAEGRMVLADAVWYACRLGATQVIDIATLTGAVIVALGTETAGIIANDDQLAASIRQAGKLEGENFWQLPSLPECREALKSETADLLNSVGRAAGCISGGLFIGEFIDAGVKWAHLDIGGTATAIKTAGFTASGGRGFGVATLVKLAELL